MSPHGRRTCNQCPTSGIVNSTLTVLEVAGQASETLGSAGVPASEGVGGGLAYTVRELHLSQIIIAVASGAFLACSPAVVTEPIVTPTMESTPVTYTISEIESLESPQTRNLVYNIQLSRPISIAEAETVALSVIDAKHLGRDPVNRLTFRFHFPGYESLLEPNIILDWRHTNRIADQADPQHPKEFRFSITDNRRMLDQMQVQPRPARD